jgi:hypothetical protein
MLAVLAVGGLAAGCGNGSVKHALSSAASDRSFSISAPTPATPDTATAESTAPTAAATTTAPASEPAVTSPAVAPAPAPASQTPAASQSPAATGTGSSLLWLWILLGVIVVVTVAVLIGRHVSRRSAAAAGWHSKIIDSYARGSALYDAMSAAEAPGALRAEDAGVRWADIQRRADDLNQELYALRETAPGEEERARVADVLASLQAARSAMTAERAAGAAGLPQGTRVRDLLAAFEASLRTLRSPRGYGAPA